MFNLTSHIYSEIPINNCGVSRYLCYYSEKQTTWLLTLCTRTWVTLTTFSWTYHSPSVVWLCLEEGILPTIDYISEKHTCYDITCQCYGRLLLWFLTGQKRMKWCILPSSVPEWSISKTFLKCTLHKIAVILLSRDSFLYYWYLFYPLFTITSSFNFTN